MIQKNDLAWQTLLLRIFEHFKTSEIYNEVILLLTNVDFLTSDHPLKNRIT